jgi:penicillin amidase
VAANQDLVAEGDLPASIALPGEYEPPWRARRISDRLGTRHDWDVPGFVDLQRDVQSQRAVAMLRMLRPRLVAEGGTSANELLAWDGAVSADSVGAHVYARLLVHLSDAVGGDEAASAGLSRSPLGPDELLRLLAGGMDESWWDDRDTPAVEGPDEIIARVLSELDRDPAMTPWGRVHQVRFEHPLCRYPIVARVLGGAWSRGPFGIGGDGTTIDAGPWSPREPFTVTAVPTLRFVADVGSWDETVMVLPPGQSGRPFSSHYSDQLAGWLEVGDGRLPFTRDAVDAAGVARLRLEPAGTSPSPTPGLLDPGGS